jgi:hypothetical protein
MNLSRLVRLGYGSVVLGVVMYVTAFLAPTSHHPIRTEQWGSANVVFASDLWFGSADFLDWLQIPESDARTDDRLLWVIKGAVNWILGMLAFTMLILILWGWFQMLTAGWDSWKYDTGFAILKNAIIWLALTALAWMIISLIIFVITLVANANTAPAGTDS